MKCADLDTQAILRFLKQHKGEWVTWWRDGGGGMPTIAEIIPGHVPEKLLLAKLDKLRRKKLITGCSCGCRGDFEITPAGESFLVGPSEQDP